MSASRRTRCLLLAAGLAFASSVVPAGAEVTDREARKWRPDMAAAREYANSRAGEVGFAVVDLAGRMHQRNGGATAAMASTFKVMLMVAYLRQGLVEDRRLTRDEKALIRPMIRRSDNEAATRMRDMLGRGPIEALAARAGMKHFRWNAIWVYCRTSARDQAVFLRKVHRLVPRRHRDFAMRQLAGIVKWQRWGVGQVEPDGWKLYFKGGWGRATGAVDHQVAQLERDGRRIGVGVLTQASPSHAYGKRTLLGVFRRLLRDLPR